MGFRPEFGCRALPARCIWQGSGFAADQTNAMLATSNGGDKSSRKRKSLRLLGTAGFMEGFAIYSRETRCFFCWLSRDFFSLHTALFRHSCVVVSLPSACASCCRNAGRPRVTAAYSPFLCRPGIRPVWAEYPRGGYNATHPLTAHTAAHTAKHGAFSPPETSAGSIGSTAWVPCASSLSARCSSMSRFPLLRRTTAEMPILLSAATLCRIRRDTFFGVPAWGWDHYPRRAIHAVETLDARGSRRLIRRFYAAPEFAPCGQNIPAAGTTPPIP